MEWRSRVRGGLVGGPSSSYSGEAEGDAYNGKQNP